MLCDEINACVVADTTVFKDKKKIPIFFFNKLQLAAKLNYLSKFP